MIYVCMFDEGAAGAALLSVHSTRKLAEEAQANYRSDAYDPSEFVIEEVVLNELDSLWKNDKYISST